MVCPQQDTAAEREGFSPAWLYRCRPAEFRGNPWLGEDPGLSLANLGVFILFLVHFACIAPVITAVAREGFHVVQCLWLLPLIALWAFLVPADIRFRLLGANRQQRLAFDHAALEWFARVSFTLFSLVFVVVWPVSIIYFMLEAFGCL
jgi:hypothetical protein